MGQLVTDAFASVLKGLGFHAHGHRANDEGILKLGRANTSCKECLPLILTTGTLLSYIKDGRRPDEILVYFMPTGCGPCRFGQYSVFMEDLIRRLEIPDVALLSLSSDNSYVGMDRNFERCGWWAAVVSDVMEDIRSMLLVDSADRAFALRIYEEEWHKILLALEQADMDILASQLAAGATRLASIPLRQPPRTVPVISLTGEIFVRRDALSRQYLTEFLADRGFATACAPVSEWIYYCQYLADRGSNAERLMPIQRFKLKIRHLFQRHDERRIKSILAGSGLVRAGMIDVAEMIRMASPFISSELHGEAVLTIGGSLADAATHSCGVIAIGPFGCMPNRISEAILGEIMTPEMKLASDPDNPKLREMLSGVNDLPFLAIESDGSPFPQLINAKLEAFLLRADRFHRHSMALHDN